MFEIFGKFCGFLYIVDNVKPVCHSHIVIFGAILAYTWSVTCFFKKYLMIFLKIEWNFCQFKEVADNSIKDSQKMVDNIIYLYEYKLE